MLLLGRVNCVLRIYQQNVFLEITLFKNYIHLQAFGIRICGRSKMANIFLFWETTAKIFKDKWKIRTSKLNTIVLKRGDWIYIQKRTSWPETRNLSKGITGYSGEEVGNSIISVRGDKSFTGRVRRAGKYCHLPCWSWPVQVVLYCWSWILGRTSCSGHSYGIHISLEYETTERNIKFISCANKSVLDLHRNFFSLTEK